MPGTRKPNENEPPDGQPMKREEWLAYHVARAPKITPQQWADTLLLLQTQEQNDDDERQDEENAS